MGARAWVKLWTSWYTSASHDDVSADALSIGPVLMTYMRWAPGVDEAWAEKENGKPISTAAIARRAKWPETRARKALLELVDAGTVALRVDGTWGFPKYGFAQESADAARKRKVRGHSNGQSSPTSGGCPDEGEAEGEAEADSLRSEPPLTPPGKSVPPHTLESEQEALALSGEAEATDPTPPLVRHVLDELTRAKASLEPGARGPRDTPANRKLIAAATKLHALDAQLWSLAIRRQLANVRTNRSNWTYLSLSTLCRPNNGVMGRLIDAPDSGPASPRGRAEPGPRPTSTRVVDLRALTRPEETP